MNDADVDKLASHVAYEIDMMIALHARLVEWLDDWDVGDLLVRNAVVEAYLVHLRTLGEMLLPVKGKVPRADDMQRTFFRPEWEARPVSSSEVVRQAMEDANKYAMHLTIKRIEAGSRLESLLDACPHMVRLLAEWIEEVDKTRFFDLTNSVKKAGQVIPRTPPDALKTASTTASTFGV